MTCKLVPDVAVVAGDHVLCPPGELPDPSETAHHGWALDILSRIFAAPALG